MRDKRCTRSALILTSILAFSITDALGQTEMTLYQFRGNADGRHSYAGLILDRAGNLYGTTPDGGAHLTCGTVFELSFAQSGWNRTTLDNFNCRTGTGSRPGAALVFDKAGNLYGTTTSGGTFSNGTVFELTSGSNGWTETVLYNFAGVDDGSGPNSDLVWDPAGNLYGTTTRGGTASCRCGTIFQLKPSGAGWIESVLYSFDGITGQSPRGVVLYQGALYGVSYLGGASGSGTVFKLSRSSGVWQPSVLYSFTGTKDGGNPVGKLVVDSMGHFYGVASAFGYFLQFGKTCSTTPFCGTVFELENVADSWLLTSIYEFQQANGAFPGGGLVMDNAGNLYGTTVYGGSYLSGTVFKLAPSASGWTQTVLHSFPYANGADGMNPQAGLVRDHAGHFFGTTASGAYGDGTIFEIIP